MEEIRFPVDAEPRHAAHRFGRERAQREVGPDLICIRFYREII